MTLTRDAQLAPIAVSPVLESALRTINGDTAPSRRITIRAGDDGASWTDDSSALASNIPLAVDEADLPPLTDVLAFAARKGAGGMADMSRLYSSAVREATKETLARPDPFADTTDVGLVIIDGNVLAARAIVTRLNGARAVLVTDARETFGGAAALAALNDDVGYEFVASDDAADQVLFLTREILADPLPIHFFTIVLNGMPFVAYHETLLTSLTCRWHWHIVEGVADLVKDTAWSVEHGGRIPQSLHRDGRSIDGTSEYLDDLAARHPDRVTIYRQPLGSFWDGKLAMVTAPLAKIDERCLLWQIDADELWSTQQIEDVRNQFLAEQKKTAAFFWCNYYVGPDWGISTRFNYAQNPAQDWLRVWRFVPGMRWDAHEPPVLVGIDPLNDRFYDVGKQAPFSHAEMERIGAVFDHFAYATQEQVLFKESYYGYRDAVARWHSLQGAGPGSRHLRDYFDWVCDETMIDTIDRLGWHPLARQDRDTGAWRFRTNATHPWDGDASTLAERPARIVVDGVFFQMAKTGIARYWQNLLLAWVRSGFAERVVLLDRGGTAPRLDGVVYRSVERHPLDRFAEDAAMLQRLCDEEGAALFLSSYYTSPTRTPTVFVGYDMIPEAMGFDLNDPWWQQKRRAILQASGHTMISHSSARELARFYEEVDRDKVLVSHCAVDPVFLREEGPDDARSLQAFKDEHGLDRDYILLVGTREGWKGYKNGIVVYAALALIAASERPLLLCVGGEPTLGSVGSSLLQQVGVRMLRLNDEDLRLAYAGARAFVCPSFYEGFGIPIIEAMAMGCPVLTCRTTSIPEVAGEAALYFDPRNPAELAGAIRDVGHPDLRKSLVERGHRQVTRFDQDRSAEEIAAYCLATIETEARPSCKVERADPYAALSDLETAHVRIGLLEGELHAAKLVLSDQTRRHGGRHTSAFDPSGSQLAEVIVLEKRLAAAMAEVEALDVTARQTALPPGMMEGVEVGGVNGVEGPLPDQDIVRAFQWQVEPTSTFAFLGRRSGAALLVIECVNIAPDQDLTVVFNGKALGHARVPATGWTSTLSIRAKVTLTGRRDTVEIRASSLVTTPERDLYLAIYRVHFVRRKTSQTQSLPPNDLAIELDA